MSAEGRADARRRQSWYGLKRPIKRAVSLPGVNQVAHAVTRSSRGVDAAARLPAPMGVHQVHGRIDDITFVMNNPAQCIIAKELYWGKGRRPRAQDQFALDVFARLSQDAGKVLDIGSYTGVFSIIAAKVNRAIPVDAFEIVPSNFLAAWDNVIANDLVDRVTVHLTGVGQEGSIRMPAATGGSALPDFWSIDDEVEGQDGTARVPIITLAQAIAVSATERDAHILVKVDVEGHESDIITADPALIHAVQPTFLMEVLPGADVEAMLAVFRGPGLRPESPYRYYLITEDRVRERPEPQGEDDYRDWLITTLTPEDLTGLGIPVDGLA